MKFKRDKASGAYLNGDYRIEPISRNRYGRVTSYAVRRHGEEFKMELLLKDARRFVELGGFDNPDYKGYREAND